MSKKKKKGLPTDVFRAVNTQGFEFLTPLFDTCQAAFNDKLFKYHDQLDDIIKYQMQGEYSAQDRGYFIRDVLRPALGENPLKGKMANGGVYYNMIIDQVFRLMLSLYEKKQEYVVLKAHDFKLTKSTWTDLHKLNLYPTRAELKNLLRSHKEPTIPMSARFVMDYSVSNEDAFRMNKDTLKCRVHLQDHHKAQKNCFPEWKYFQLYMPSYVRDKWVLSISKPSFFRDKHTNELVCTVRYKCKVPKLPKTYGNIMGIDLGQVKPYCAAVLDTDENKFIGIIEPSKELMRLRAKLNRLEDRRDILFKRLNRITDYRSDGRLWTNHQRRCREDYLSVRHKISNLQEHIAWLIAEEVVQYALKNHCKTIKVENLSWVGSKGGKWSYSLVQKRIKEIAELAGILMVKVNPQNTSKRHPKTGEIGKIHDRDVVFQSGQHYDRDRLAAMNIALVNENGGYLSHRLEKPRIFRGKHKSRRKVNLLRKKVAGLLNKDQGRMNQVVSFFHKQATAMSNALVSNLKKIYSTDDDNLARSGFRHYNYVCSKRT